MYSTPLSDTAKARLKAMLETADGFEIARRDLEIRGPGEFFGARQSGAPLLRFADLVLDEALVQQARGVAQRLLPIASARCPGPSAALARRAHRVSEGLRFRCGPREHRQWRRTHLALRMACLETITKRRAFSCP